MLAIRIHLDDANDQNGALEILSASHRFGRVPASQTSAIVAQSSPISCDAKTGDILIMKMLTLHRSKSSNSVTDRRAIRIDYSADILPPPLRWELSAA